MPCFHSSSAGLVFNIYGAMDMSILGLMARVSMPITLPSHYLVKRCFWGFIFFNDVFTPSCAGSSGFLAY